MRIIQLVYHLGSGGAEKFVVNLSNQLADMNHEVFLVQLRNDQDYYNIDFNKQFLSEKVKYINLELSKGYSLRKALKVMREIRNISPDVVHSHLNILPYYYPLIFFNNKVKFIHTLHNVADKECSIKWQQILNRYVYKSDKITPVTISDECSLSYENLYGVSSRYQIENGCPIVNKSSFYSQVEEEVAKLKPTCNTLVFIHVARFHEAKNQKMLISSFNEIIKSGVDAMLIILGDGFDSENCSEIRRQACDRIHFLGAKTNVGDYLYQSNYFILSSLWEGLPISLLEAMSIKLIPICTPAGGIRDVLVDGINGFMPNEFTENSFIEAIKRALNTKIEKERIYDTYESKYSMQKCTMRYLEVYSTKL